MRLTLGRDFAESDKTPARTQYDVNARIPRPGQRPADVPVVIVTAQVESRRVRESDIENDQVIADGRQTIGHPTRLGGRLDQVPALARYALRSVTEMYRTTPLRGLYRPPQLQGPYFHNGVATTLEQVVDRYVTKRTLTLTPQQRADLVQFLRSL
jgi:hypothetical protein